MKGVSASPKNMEMAARTSLRCGSVQQEGGAAEFGGDDSGVTILKAERVLGPSAQRGGCRR